MARTEAGAQLTQSHRRQQLALRAATLRDLLTLWPMVDALDLAGTIQRFAVAVALLAQQRHQESAALAAAYFRAFRQAEEVQGQARPLLADRLALEAAAGLLRGAALVGIINARRAGQPLAAAGRTGLVRTSGSLTALVLSGGRQTLTRSVDADQQAKAWQRVTSGDACAFCRMLASRGAVYKTRRAAHFEAHDNCACGVEPYYSGSKFTDQALTDRAQWQRAQREARDAGELVRGTSNDALNAFRRHLGG